MKQQANPSSNKSLLISFILLSITFLGFLSLKYTTSRQPDKQYYFSNLDNPDKICFNDFCLNKKDNHWFISEKDIPVDPEKINQFINQCQQIKLEELISKNPDKSKSLGFADDQKNILKIGDNQLEIGRIADSYDSTYVKNPDSNDIYIIPFAWNLSTLKQDSYWQNSTVTNLPIYQIQKIVISQDNQETEITKKDDKWENDQFIDTVSHLSASDYLGKQAPSNPFLTINIEIENDQTYSLEIGQQKISWKESVYWAKTPDNFYYKIAEEDFNTLTSFSN
ncbi:DUF4340 domain-containing protein [Patescibacteria group bacterium]|nr:DUF4340 domain-containing protein [Patescibacteria group bacterium]